MPAPMITARWRGLEDDGLDQLDITHQDDGLIVARGAVVGSRGAKPYGVFYRVNLDPAWTVREVAIGTTAGQGLHLLTDGNGRWSNGVGENLAQFDGCLDVDLAGTPFTNTLPIRRLQWAAGTRHELSMVYVPFDSFVPMVDRQIYTCETPGEAFLYEAADRTFSARITVDGNGLVTDYENLFTRIL
jgi:uncharacterized protein